MMHSLPLAITCGNYDRTRPLFDGQVLIEGCNPILLPQPPEEIFFRAFVHEEFDVSELSLSSYTMRRSNGDCLYIGIPVFISRTFRRSAIYVRTDRAFLAAKEIAVAALSDPNALCVSLPSLIWSAEGATALMGKDFWPYGLDENVGTLEAFPRYHFEQGLSRRRLTPGELFAPSTSSQWRI